MSCNSENSVSVAYNESVQLTLLDICAPLFQTFGLMTFGYKRVFKDGSYLFLSTNTQWQSHHLYEIHNHGQFFKNAMLECADTPEFAFYRTMWPSSPSDHFLQSLNQYGMWNGINFYRKKDDSIELWTFSTNPEQHQDPNSYIKILNHLERFIAFFNVKACNIIDVSDKSKLAKFKDGLDLVLIDEADLTSNDTGFFLENITPDCRRVACDRETKGGGFEHVSNDIIFSSFLFFNGNKITFVSVTKNGGYDP